MVSEEWLVSAGSLTLFLVNKRMSIMVKPGSSSSLYSTKSLVLQV